ncbi:MAG: glycosyltransferase, partial [Acidimicrobiales bacterium]
MDAEPAAPPVVAVVMTSNPGDWFEQTLVALATQDYPNQSVLVMDTGSSPVPASRVAQVLPEAYLRRPEVQGFAAVANDVLQIVEGAAFLVFCHDDVALERPAVRLLVEEALRSNAGIVAPKVVEWERPDHLLEVGLAIDKTGASGPLVERGELDQEQHDAVRDVFEATGGCTLVRADLFSTLGGFDREMRLLGEDLDLSWRAHLAGARVVVAPAARVRHREATVSGLRPLPHFAEGMGRTPRDRVRPLVVRHRLRAVLKAYGAFHLVRVLPQMALLAAAEVGFAVLSGRPQVARAIIGAWRWNFGRMGELRAARRQVQGLRAIPDGELRRLQVRGSARFSAFIRGTLTDDRAQGLAAAGRDLAGTFRGDDLRVKVAFWATVTAVLVVGSRHLLAGPVPAVGQLVPFPHSPMTFLRHFGSGWRASGLGSAAPAPAAFALLGLAGVALGGAMGLLRQVMILGPVAAGIVGAFRLARPLGPG